MAKQQALIKELRSSYLTLMHEKWRAEELELDLEWTEPIPELVVRFHKAWFAAHDGGLDPTVICVELIRRYWKNPWERGSVLRASPSKVFLAGVGQSTPGPAGSP